MRKLAMLIALVIAVLFTGTVFASEAQEQLIHEQFGTGSYATWLRDDGTWDKGPPGSLQQTKPHEYSIPAEKLENVKLTRIVVKTGYSFDPDTFEKAGGWQRIASYSKYVQEILKYTPDNLMVTDTHDLSTGKVNVTWSLRLSPTSWQGGREARFTVDPNVRNHLRQLGFNLEDDKAYADFRQGWLWCLPVHIQWYGIPQGPPDFSARFHQHEFTDVQPGQKIKSKVTYKLNEDHPGPETARVELYHDTRDGKTWPIEGVHGQELLFQPGQEYTFDYEATVQAHNTTMEAVIRPVSSGVDRDWNNNRDKAEIIVKKEELCTDISVKMDYFPRQERQVGWNTEVRVTISRDHSGPDAGKLGGSGVRVKYRYDNGKWQYYTLKKGQSITVTHKAHHTQAGNEVHVAEAWPDDYIEKWELVRDNHSWEERYDARVGKWAPPGYRWELVRYNITECHPPNNTASLSIPVDQHEIPVGDGQLNLGLTGGR